MTVELTTHIKDRIGDAMSLAWGSVETGGLAPLGDLGVAWGNFTPRARVYLREVAQNLVQRLADQGVVTLANRDYQPCDFDDYEVGDWALITDTEDGSRFEFQVTGTSLTQLQGVNVRFSDRTHFRYARHADPIVRPDPSVDSIIVDHDNNDALYEAAERLGGYAYFMTGSTIPREPEYFKNWTAMKLVKATEED